MNKINKKNKFLILGLGILLSLISIGTYATNTQPGMIGSLFEKISTTDGDDIIGEYRLKGDMIKNGTIDNSEIQYNDTYTINKLGVGTHTPTEKLEVNGNIKTLGRNIIFGNGKQKIYGDNNSTSYIYSNNSDYSQIILKDKENISYGAILGSYNGDNFGLLDGDGDWSYRAIKDYRTYFYINGGIKMYIDNNGGVHATSFIYTSDKRLKKEIKTLSGTLEKINKLRGVHFKWKKNNFNEIGLIAQEIENVYPELVFTDDDGYKAVKYGNIVAILIEGIKEQNKKIKKLEEKYNTLEQIIKNNSLIYEK